MKELRDIKLDLLMGNQNPIIDLFCEITSGIEIINCNVYNEEGLEFIYHKDGQWIFYQDAKNGEFWCNFSTYWSFFECKLGLEYLEIQSITKYLVEEALKREVTTPCSHEWQLLLLVEEALKREVATPTPKLEREKVYVQDALKREVATPIKISHPKISAIKVEDALKREVATPFTSEGPEEIQVEDALKRNLEK